MMRFRQMQLKLVLVAVLTILAACGAGGSESGTEQASASRVEGAKAAAATPAEPTEEPIFRYNQLLGRDSIRPVYEPTFAPADAASLADNELVLGIEIDGEAKAYPIVVLNRREMVNDELAGIPILATW